MPKKRIKTNKKIKPVLHIFCEGKETEPNYIKGYLNDKHPTNRRLSVISVEKTQKNTPCQLVDEAFRLKSNKDTPKIDEFWVVYDRESSHKYSDELHAKAYQKARAHNINIAISSVCFEVWLLLHFIDLTTEYNSCSDLLKNSKLKPFMQEKGIDFAKSSAKIYPAISENTTTAITRAEWMNKETLKASDHTANTPYKLNPYTTVHLLLRAIDDFVDMHS